jgi:hypothetical protein
MARNFQEFASVILIAFVFIFFGAICSSSFCHGSRYCAI